MKNLQIVEKYRIKCGYKHVKTYKNEIHTQCFLDDKFCCNWEKVFVYHKIIGCAQLRELVLKKGINSFNSNERKKLNEIFYLIR